MSLKKNVLKSVHAGEILLKDFMKPNKITAYRLSKIIGLSQTHIGRIIKSKRPITLDTALRLARAFNTSPEFWLNIQNRYDIDNLSEELKEEIAKIQPIEKRRVKKMQVKVLSVKNPFAYLIIQGGKDVENRTWTTDYRGRIYIHVSGDNMPFPLEEDYPDLKSDKKYDSYVLKIRDFHKNISDHYEKFGITEDTDINSWIKKTDIWFLKSQSIIGYVDLIDIVKDSSSPWSIDRQYHWILKNPTLLKNPIRQVKGKLGLWDYNLPE